MCHIGPLKEGGPIWPPSFMTELYIIKRQKFIFLIKIPQLIIQNSNKYADEYQILKIIEFSSK